MKSSLDELYQFSESAKKLGIELSPDQIEQMKSLEDDLIRENVVPVIESQLLPVLNHIRRPLSISLDYDPESGIDVKILRNDEAEHIDRVEDIQPAEAEALEETVTESLPTPDEAAQNGGQASYLEYNLEELSLHMDPINELDRYITNRKPYKLKIGEMVFDVKNFKDAYIQLLKYMYELDGEKMSSFIVTGIPGVEKPSYVEKRFRKSGETFGNPFEISDGLWVETKLSGRYVLRNIIHLLEPYGISKSDCVIYLSDSIRQNRKDKESRKERAASKAESL